MKVNLILICLWALAGLLVFVGILLLNAVVFNLGLGLMIILLIIQFGRMLT